MFKQSDNKIIYKKNTVRFKEMFNSLLGGILCHPQLTKKKQEKRHLIFLEY